MLNGKFFTGLPPKMIEKSGGRNHQKTNFFWPDETNLQSVPETKIKKKTSRNNSIDTSCSPQFEPQQLFKKELTSKIEFYDLIDDDLYKSRNRNINNMKNNDKSYMKTKKSDKLKSDFDYVDGKYDRTERNIKKDIDRNKTDSPKLINKRITFENNDKKVNIKNNDIDKRPPILKHRVGLVNKNKTLSKSVDNLPVKLLKNNNSNDEDLDDSINVIENDVKNFKIPIEKDYCNDDRDYEFDKKEFQQRNSDSKSTSKYFKDNKEFLIPEVRRPYPQNHNYERNYENEKGFFKSQRKNDYDYDEDYHNRGEDDYFYRNSRDKYNYDNDRRIRNIEIRLSPSRESIQKVKTNRNENEKRNHNHLTNRSNRKNEEISSTSKNQLNEQQLNKNRHLKSNIIFSDHIDNQPTSVPERKTIRSSAVARVSVGLPEF